MSRSSWYRTTYPARPHWTANEDDAVGDYCSFIWASSLKHAQRLAKRRGIGERVVAKSARRMPYALPSQMLRRNTLNKNQALDAVHAVCFMSYLLMRSTGAKAEDVLGDEGLLHMAIHSLTFGWPGRRRLADGIEYFERMIPGYRTDWRH